MSKHEKTVKILTFLFLAALAFVWVFPLVWGICTSFKPETEIKTMGFHVLPVEWVLDNYIKVIWNKNNFPVIRWFFNSALMSGVSTVLSVALVSVTAYGYTRFESRFLDRMFYLVMAVSLFPSIVNLIPMYQIVSSLGWVNTILAAIVPGFAGVTNIFLVRQFLLGIPKEFDEAARTDGANEVKTFLFILVPMLKPVLTVVALFNFTGVWNDFLWPTIVFNDVERMPITAGLQLMRGPYKTFDMGVILAAAIIAIVPTFMIYLFSQKYFLSSLSLGAGIKG